MPGVLLLIHPDTADMICCHKGEGALARAAILDGYNPIGPRGAEAARILRARALNPSDPVTTSQEQAAPSASDQAERDHG